MRFQGKQYRDPARLPGPVTQQLCGSFKYMRIDKKITVLFPVVQQGEMQYC